MVGWKFISLIAIALVASTNGNMDDDLIIDPNGYLTYCPCMGEFHLPKMKGTHYSFCDLFVFQVALVIKPIIFWVRLILPNR